MAFSSISFFISRFVKEFVDLIVVNATVNAIVANIDNGKIIRNAKPRAMSEV